MPKEIVAQIYSSWTEGVLRRHRTTHGGELAALHSSTGRFARFSTLWQWADPKPASLCALA